MNDPKQADIDDILSFLSPRLREILRRLAYCERRSELQELISLIEARALGKLLYNEGRDITPIIPLNDLPSAVVDRVIVQRTDPSFDREHAPPPTSPGDSPNDLPYKT